MHYVVIASLTIDVALNHHTVLRNQTSCVVYKVFHLRTPHCSDGPGMASHGTLRVLDIPRRRHGRVAAPRRHVHVHWRVRPVSRRTALTDTDLLYLDVVQQESRLVTNSADSESRPRVGGCEVIHEFLPLARGRYGRCNDECDVDTWQSDEAELLGVEAFVGGGTDVERHSILRRRLRGDSLLYVAADDVKVRVSVLPSAVAVTRRQVERPLSRPLPGNSLPCA